MKAIYSNTDSRFNPMAKAEVVANYLRLRSDKK